MEFFPNVDKPEAVAIISCSAIPISKNLFGNFFANMFVLVAPDKSASKTTIFLLFSPNCANTSHNFL